MKQDDRNTDTKKHNSDNEVAEEKARRDTNIENVDTEHNAENDEAATGKDEHSLLGTVKKTDEKENEDDDEDEDPEIETGEALDGALNNPAVPNNLGKQVSNTRGRGVPDGDGGSVERNNPNEIRYAMS